LWIPIISGNLVWCIKHDPDKHTSVDDDIHIKTNNRKTIKEFLLKFPDLCWSMYFFVLQDNFIDYERNYHERTDIHGGIIYYGSIIGLVMSFFQFLMVYVYSIIAILWHGMNKKYYNKILIVVKRLILANLILSLIMYILGMALRDHWDCWVYQTKNGYEITSSCQ